MTRIADLLDRDLSRQVEEFVKVYNGDPDTVIAELAEYVATDRIKAEYERLFSAMAAAPKSPTEGVGVWVSGFPGSGKSSFAKNVAYVLTNRELHGSRASSLLLKQLESNRVTESVEFLNRVAPYETFVVDVEAEISPRTNGEHIAELMYRSVLRGLDYAEDNVIADLEIELEQAGRLAAFQDLCRAEYKEEWRTIRNGDQRSALSSALLHGLDPRTYPSTDTWLKAMNPRLTTKLSVKDVVDKSFDRCEVRRRGKAFAFIVDEVGQYVAHDAARLEELLSVVEQFGKESLDRLKTGKTPGPAWILVTAQESLQEICNRLEASRIDLPRLRKYFGHEIHLTSADIREVVARRVLRKKASQESILGKLFQERGAPLIQNVKLEQCSRHTEFDQDQFVRFYPYLPHLIDLSIDVMAGVRQQPNAPKYIGSSNRTIVKQSFEMLASDPARLANQPVGVLVSIDKIYELVEGNTPWEKRKDILDIRQRFDNDVDYPGIAARVAKALCLMELVTTDLPRTTDNIAALLLQRVTEAPPRSAVAAMLDRLKAAEFVRETEGGWTLYDFDELRRAAKDVEWRRNAVGILNPRKHGLYSDLIQSIKRLLARSLTWYTRPLQEFHVSVSQSLQEIVHALDHLSASMVALDRLSMDPVGLERRMIVDKSAPQLLDHLSMTMAALDELSMNVVALGGRLAQSERRSASLAQQLERLQEQLNALVKSEKAPNVQPVLNSAGTDCDKPANDNSGFLIATGVGETATYKTAYIVGLFGTGRHYVNEVTIQNIGERAKYFRDTIRLHPGPTPMIYSGHATVKHVSRAQELPAVMSSILKAVRSEFADLIFVYRHPLDSLLTNWIWWRTYVRENRSISGISQVYKTTDALCADLEEHFLNFRAFCEGDPEFFAGLPGPRFLSFAEFVEETELHLQSATLALRLEDFMADPLSEFSKIVEVMSVEIDLSGVCITPPRTKPYGYRDVRDKVPRFKNCITGLSPETMRRIEHAGYNV